ncbi:glycosyltransferase family 20 protein [Xylona heveae TC161]|uniref:Glycosyltransferase family 20 protein n=1 Tax=Xylona heveae (strain CBS 132557 / TC161) TaxID=1328760 RepID=A0A165K269_XYLHT|nr:glycosyltransferase family 20 protein [Xylona heveae TC161]KZF26903.1 glycosyltransferase family 20 protein [Xylona heveae TC161]
MTVIVASLTLPYTIHFDIPVPSRRPSPPRRQNTNLRQDQNNHEPPSLLRNQSSQGPTPPATPGIDGDHQEFFSKPPALPPAIKKELRSGSIATSESHSPRWNVTQFNQPRSRASSPPPASILKHAKIVEKARTDALRRRRSVARASVSSHDQLIQTADWTVVPAEGGNGGLKNAIRAASKAGKLDDKTWVGTLGMPTDALEDSQKTEIEDKLINENDCIPVFVTDSDFDGHYSHYCKTILWPVFHYQIPDNPKSKAYEDHSWVYYVKINQAFADRIVKHYKRGDVIWVHDYHLLLVPAMVRKQLPDAQIGFFLHVAFPSSEVFRCLAVRKELLEGLLGANLIGFQTEEYCYHFLQTCSRLLCVEATSDGVQLEDRFVNIINLPIGIDPVALDERRATTTVAAWLQVIQERYRGKFLIVARDKLDHVRGVRQKLLAYELFLNKYPEYRGKVVLLQVATSTTEQAELDATVSDIITRVNSSFATLAHQPLVFLKQDIGFPQYLALCTVANALMITSLREGMNLTSHEFLCCQDGRYTENKHGSLILSEFTGSANVFGGAELSVNPWDYRKCAEAIKTAIEMSPEEKDERWNALHKIVMHHTAAHWCTSFIEQLSSVWKEQAARETISIPRLSVGALGEKYRKAERRLFILDYEGTLAPYGSPASMVLTSSQRTLDVLNDLLLDDKNIVYVMSGRQPEDLHSMFRRVPDLGLIAERGCFVREFGKEEFHEMGNLKEMSAWKEDVRGILDYYRERTEGSWVEERHCSLTFHYSSADDPQAAARQAGDCVNHINDACESQRVHAIPVDKSVLVEPMDWSKGTAALHVFDLLKQACAADGSKMPDFLMVVGDDREDEPIFRWANRLAQTGIVRDVSTVSVGSRNTEAMSTLTQGVTGVLTVLGKLASFSDVQ